MPARPTVHRPMGWRPPEPWQRSAGQQAPAHRLPSSWPKLRQQVLRDQPLCQPCLRAGFVRPSREVDHIVPRSQGGTSDRANLQGICVECHRAKTRGEARKVSMHHGSAP